MNFLLFFNRFFPILTFLYPPSRYVSCCLSGSYEFLILLVLTGNLHDAL